MNTDRLLREVEKRLAHLSDADRAEALDAVREEIGRERRREAPHATVETERERRTEAETLREILEAINRQPSLDDTIEEVLKQLTRIVVCDSCSVGLIEADGSFRITAITCSESWRSTRWSGPRRRASMSDPPPGPRT